jgi:type III secretion protein W
MQPAFNYLHFIFYFMTEPRISHALPMNALVIKAILKEEAAESIVQQVESEGDLNQDCIEPAIFNPMTIMQRFRNLKEMHSKEPEKAEGSEEVEEKIVSVEKIDEASERFQKNNYELNAKTLRILKAQVKPGDTADEVLEKVGQIYKDAALADESLDFLMEVSEGALLAATAEAKEKLNKDKGKEIRAGRNMGAQAREFAQEGLGSPTSLRELYRDITLNPREPIKLFDELTEKFPYPKVKTAIHFMLHSLGSDMKSKGPSIQRGELKRLIDETRSMQGILGVFRFFQSRMRLIQREFNSYNLLIPPRITFDYMARIFVKMLGERFMNPEKIILTAKHLGIAEEKAAQIVIFTQMRDALKQIAPKYFRDPRHREELLRAFIDTLEKLEDELEEEEEGEK